VDVLIPQSNRVQDSRSSFSRAAPNAHLPRSLFQLASKSSSELPSPTLDASPSATRKSAPLVTPPTNLPLRHSSPDYTGRDTGNSSPDVPSNPIRSPITSPRTERRPLSRSGPTSTAIPPPETPHLPALKQSGHTLPRTEPGGLTSSLLACTGESTSSPPTGVSAASRRLLGMTPSPAVDDLPTAASPPNQAPVPSMASPPTSPSMRRRTPRLNMPLEHLLGLTQSGASLASPAAAPAAPAPSPAPVPSLPTSNGFHGVRLGAYDPESRRTIDPLLAASRSSAADSGNTSSGSPSPPVLRKSSGEASQALRAVSAMLAGNKAARSTHRTSFGDEHSGANGDTDRSDSDPQSHLSPLPSRAISRERPVTASSCASDAASSLGIGADVDSDSDSVASSESERRPAGRASSRLAWS
jgi:hypothetical protein